MSLAEIRKEIDAIDPKIRALLMKRLDCSRRIAEAKNASGDLRIYRPDRENEILARLSEEVPEEKRAGYLAVVRKIMQTSRMPYGRRRKDVISAMQSSMTWRLNLIPEKTRKHFTR